MNDPARRANLVGRVRERWLAPVRLGLSVLGVVTVIAIYAQGGPGFDFYAYWRAAQGDPYAVPWGFGAYHYAPPVVVLFVPFTALPFEAAYWGWTALMVGLLAWMCRGWTLAALAFLPVTVELYHGNIHLVYAAMCVVGLRYPGAWAFGVLTKIGPGVGLVWFAARQEWRSLATGLGVTGAIAAVSFALDPGTWAAWTAHVTAWSDTTSPNQIVVPLVLRLPAAVLLIAYAAWTDRRWLVPVGVLLAIPVLWIHAFAVLIGILPLAVARRPDRA